MHLLIALGILVAAIAVAVFKVNKWQNERYMKLARKAKKADDPEDEE
ncbi:MAG TPA: hypothetical protein IAC50_08970 [Candidatus Copromorpha excrementigallinarum]|uniref:DUF2897 domain-containing protein n=1 Tax=Candidatus Allocopromorpha excrementigallinarum TaxID=2840742 RepID=A0A9D1I1M5_9FIRM|nr:hypothetical protein [Candidatus Copromorpha excrementigallinarum]